MPGPEPTPSGVVKVAFTIATDSSAFSLAYTGGPPSVAALDGIAAAARSAFGTHLAPLLSSDFGLTQTTARDLANPATPLGVDTTEVVGSRGGGLKPANVATLINFSVNRLYRGSKPKIWLPFGTTSDFASGSDNLWAGSFTSAVDTGWNAFIGELNGTAVSGTTLGAQMAVSYYSGKMANPNPTSRLRYLPVPRTVPLVMTVEAVACRQMFGSQRRRIARPGA